MSLIIAPNGFRARQREELSKEEIDLVIKMTNWCERRGLRFDLLCEKCYNAGDPCRCVGDNSRDSTTFKINCAHTDRIYGPSN